MTARVVEHQPIFFVADVPRAVAHYELLGFKTSIHDESYAFAHRDDLTIHLAGAEDNPAVPGGGSLYIHVDGEEQAR